MDSGKNPLQAIVCGYERGGTSLIAELLRQHPSLDGGFEGGFLLGKKPRDFLSLSPYRSNVKPGWGITEEELRYICDTDSWQDLYGRLREKAKVIREESTVLFDKTPKYMEDLSRVMQKIPHVPCIVVVRDPRAVLWSWAKRSGVEAERWTRESLKSACQRYVAYGKGWQAAVKRGLSSRMLRIPYERFCADPAFWAERMFGLLGLEFNESFLHFQPRFPNVYGNAPSQAYVDEYKKHFSDEICRKILARTKKFSDWQG